MKHTTKRCRLLRLLITAAVIAPAAAARGADETVSALLERQTQELMDAVSTGTAAVWERYLDPAAVYVDESGNVSSKKDMVDGIKPLAAGVSGVIRVTGFRAVVSGDLAVATHVDDENESYHGHPLHCQYRTTDTWRKTPDGWSLAAGQVLALRTDPPATPISESLRREYSGRYALTSEIAYEIRARGDALEGERTGRKPETLLGEAPDVLFVPGEPRYRKIFQRGLDGRVTGFVERREAWDILWKRVP
jgi:ketosteroid isomerase-like protein